jgi:uncharacterized protein
MGVVRELRALPLPGVRGVRRRPGRRVAREVFRDPGVAALAVAVRGGRGRRVRELVAGGVDPDARGQGGVGLLQWALLTRSAGGMAALLEAGADPGIPDGSGTTVVHLAAMARDPGYLRVLLDGGADPDTRHATTGETPLTRALLARTAAQFRMLLAAGADVGAADRMGDTPLHHAARHRSWAAVLRLLEAGADPHARNARGATFQTYLFGVGPAHVPTPDPREPVRAWLRAHGVTPEG